MKTEKSGKNHEVIRESNSPVMHFNISHLLFALKFTKKMNECFFKLQNAATNARLISFFFFLPFFCYLSGTVLFLVRS